MKTIFITLLVCIFSLPGFSQLNTDIFLLSIKIEGTTITETQPFNFTKRKGYDNQPFFSNNGKWIYYSANYTGKNDIYAYDIEGNKTLTITNTPATSEFSPMETPDGSGITTVFIEKDSTTQRVWKINLKDRKEKLLTKHNDSIGYYWPVEREWNQDIFESNGTGLRKVNAELEYAVFVLGNKDANSTLRLISPQRKMAPEKIINDSVGRCIRQVEHYITYIKKQEDACYLKFYDLHKRKTTYSFFMGKDNEDYCWKGKTLYFTSGGNIVVVSFAKGYDEPETLGFIDLSKYNIKNAKRISNYGDKFAVVGDDQ
ncbi:MAG TPA: hypothetical protein VK177_04920 [Flavobacteriales bacterium]|nr:hypothetical protein [Flavobacteriales bacterium]